MRRALLAVALAALPACAVLDGLGGEEGSGTLDPGQPDGGALGEEVVLQVTFTPPIIPCDTGITVQQVPLFPMADGRFLVGGERYSLEGVWTLDRFSGQGLCEGGGPFLMMEGPGEGIGSYDVLSDPPSAGEILVERS